MFDTYPLAAIQAFMSRLNAAHRQLFQGQTAAEKITADWQLVKSVALYALTAIARSDAPYHDVEHTILVTDVGQMILHGRQQLGESVSRSDWVHFTIALLCHDLGYLKGICHGDRPDQRQYVTGIGNAAITLPPGATDAGLAPYHVDRGQQVVAEQWADYAHEGFDLDLDRIQQAIARTRFPVPAGAPYDRTHDEPGLCRAADLIGQLGDRRYLQKIPALFQEFQETGMAEQLQCANADVLRANYPTFFWNVAYLYLAPALDYLNATPPGQAIGQQLFDNVDRATTALTAASGRSTARLVPVPDLAEPVAQRQRDR